MNGGWIKVDSSLPGSVKVAHLAAAVGEKPATIMGYCVQLWAWVDGQTVDGKLPIGLASLAAACGVPEDVLSAMADPSVDWLRFDARSCELPRYTEHNGDTAKARALAARRKEAERSRGGERDSQADTLGMKRDAAVRVIHSLSLLQGIGVNGRSTPRLRTMLKRMEDGGRRCDSVTRDVIRRSAGKNNKAGWVLSAIAAEGEKDHG